MLKAFGLAVLQSGLIATAASIVLVTLVARLFTRMADRRGYSGASRLLRQFGYVMCGAMIITYLYRAASNVGVALGLWK